MTIPNTDMPQNSPQAAQDGVNPVQTAQSMAQDQTTPQNPPNQPQNAPAQPAQPAAAPSAPPDHGQLFKTILGVFAGGSRRPVLDGNGNPVTDPKTGAVKTQPMTVKNLGAGILAGALSSMMAGFQHLPERDGNGVMQSHLNEASQAGAAAGAAQSAQARVKQAQGVSDAMQARRYQTMKQNLDLHSLSLAVDKQDKDQKQSLVDHAAPQLEAMSNATLEDGSPLIAGRDESETELQKRISESGGDVTRDSAIPTGKRPEIGPDGRPTGRTELLWTSFHNGGKIKVSQALKDEFPEKLGNVALGVEVPASAMTQLFLNKGTNTVANGVISGLVDKMNAFNKDQNTKAKAITLDWNQLKKENPSFGALQNKLMGLSGLDPDQFVKAAAAIDPRLGAVIQQKLGIDPSAWVVKRDQDKKEAEQEELRKNKKLENQDKAATPEGQAQLEEAKLRIEKLKNDNKTAANKIDDQDVLAEQLLDPKNLTAMKDIGGRGTDRATIIAKAARMAKERGIPFDVGLTNQRIKFLGEYENPTGRAAVNRGALNNLLQHAGDLSDINNDFRRTNVQILNTGLNKIRKQFGDQEFTKYQTVTGVLKDELGLYFAGGFAPSKEQAATWDKIQADEATPAQTEAFAKEIAGLALRRADTANESYKTVMGYEDPNLVTPAAKAAAQHLSPELAKQVEKYSSGGQLAQVPGKPPVQQARPDQLTNLMVNPATKQQIGQKPDGTWVDILTGKPVTQ